MNSIKSVGISNDVSFGNNIEIVEPVNLYGCVISDDVFIGPFVEIQKSVTVGNKQEFNPIPLYVSLFLLEVIALLGIMLFL